MLRWFAQDMLEKYGFGDAIHDPSLLAEILSRCHADDTALCTTPTVHLEKNGKCSCGCPLTPDMASRYRAPIQRK
eukprot:423118-Amphidinium_carterae.1